MNKKWLLTLALTLTLTQGMAVMAATQLPEEVTSIKINEGQSLNEEKSEYLTETGEITEITKEGENYRVLVGTPTEGTVYIVQQEEAVIDAVTLQYQTAHDLKVGMMVTMVVPKDAPVGLSLPPVCSSQVAIIANCEERSVTTGYFNQELVNETNTLALNIAKETRIISSTGEKRIFKEDDIKDQNAIVIYTITTHSIPAQTNPLMVILLPTAESEEETQTKQTAAIENTDTYVPVRRFAQENSYEVKWDNKQKTVTLLKGDIQIRFTVGSQEYTYNNEKRALNHKIKLDQQTISIPVELAEAIKG